jgi:hypothetical protein
VLAEQERWNCGVAAGHAQGSTVAWLANLAKVAAQQKHGSKIPINHTRKKLRK